MGSSTLRTSQPPIPMTLDPGLAVWMSLAAFSVFSTLRPMMQALAPRRTRALVCMLHIVPAPPVTKTTRSSEALGQHLYEQVRWVGGSLKIPSFQTGLRYSDSRTGIV